MDEIEQAEAEKAARIAEAESSARRAAVAFQAIEDLVADWEALGKTVPPV